MSQCNTKNVNSPWLTCVTVIALDHPTIGAVLTKSAAVAIRYAVRACGCSTHSTLRFRDAATSLE